MLVKVERTFDFPGVFFPQNTTFSIEAGEGTGGVSASGEPEDEDFIPWC